MNAQVKIAVSSDFNPGNAGHQAADEALDRAAGALGVDVARDWIPTQSTDTEAGLARLARYDGVFSAGGAYESKSGALQAIRFARERGRPFFGT